MIKIGLEKEFFIKNGGNYVIAPTGLPFDSCGLLAESRGLPFSCPVEAVFSLKADIQRLTDKATKMGLQLVDEPIAKIPRETVIAASRKFVKGLVKHQNLYEYKSHRNNRSELTAAVHISFTDESSFNHDKGVFKYNKMFDWVQLFKYLDKEFSLEIKEAKRNPGFYELKDDGRIEYRSLPANVNLDKVITVLKAFFEKK